MRTLRKNGLSKAATALTLLLAMPAVPGLQADAFAAEEEEEKRRVLRVDQVDEAGALSEEYRQKAREARMESIRRLKELLTTSGLEGDTKAEMMLRLAELYFTEGRDIYLSEMAAFDKQFDQCFNTEGCDTDKLTADNSRSREWQDKAIKLYQNILRSYPRYARADQATFFLGSALVDTGRRAEGVEEFKRLVKMYRDSSYVPDSYVLVGEYYFDNNEAFKALKAYKLATKYTDSPKYPFATYKLAWCFYNVGEYQQAIDSMKTVVSYSMQHAEQKSNIQLQDEALRDLVRFFADAGQMNEAYDYFNNLGKKDLIRSMLKRLAGMYYEQGKFDQSVETYRRLILEDPQNESCPEYQVEIIRAYKKMDNKEKTLEEIDRLLRDYGKDSAWARANASNPKVVNAAAEDIEKNLRTVAVEYHEQARKLEKSRHPSSDQVYGLARQAYGRYLEFYPTHEKAYEIHYAYGELLYKLKDFEGAFNEYMTVVKMDPNGKRSKFCAESAIFAADEMVKKEGGGKAPKAEPGAMKEPQPLTEWEQRLVDACNQFASLYPKDKKVTPIIYKSAELLYNKYRFEEAAVVFTEIIKKDPSSKQAEYSANLVLDSFVIKQDYANLKKYAKTYFDQEGLGSKTFKDDVFKIYQNASFKLVEETLKKDNDKGKAADGFVAYYEEFPAADNAAMALNNASIYYYEVKRPADSLKIRHILVDDPKFGPKTKYYYDQIGALGYDYETVADFEKAAFYYEKLFSLYPEERTKRLKENKDADVSPLDSKAADALFSSAVFRVALGEWEKGIENYNQFITAFPKDERIADVRLTVARTYEDQQQWDKAADVFKGYFTKPTEGAPLEFTYFARLHYGQALIKQNKLSDAKKIYTDTIAMYQKYLKGGGEPGAHTEFVAEMMYLVAQDEIDKYMTLEIKGCGCRNQRREDKALLDGLKNKAQGLVKVEETFKGIIDTGAGEWGLAALVSLGKAYENMGTTLETGDKPFYLTTDQVEIYDMGIEDKVYVQEEKAVNAFKLALDKSFELTLYNDNTAYATRRLGELRPDEYPGLRETLVEARYTSSESRTYDYENEM